MPLGDKKKQPHTGLCRCGVTVWIWQPAYAAGQRLFFDIVLFVLNFFNLAVDVARVIAVAVICLTACLA